MTTNQHLSEPVRINYAKSADRKNLSPTQGDVLTTLRPQTADQIWAADQWKKLAYHLYNNNPEHQFIMGRFGPDPENGGHPGPTYKKSKNFPINRAVPWAWDSITSKAKTKVALVLYAQNPEGMSRWASIDFDAHTEADHEIEIARHRAFTCFQATLNLKGIYLILESSGRGWHLWLLSKEFRPCQEWTNLLIDVLTQSNIPIDECELFPPVNGASNPFGKGVRAPGSWSPAKRHNNEIWYENIEPILCMPVSLKEKDDSLSFSSLSLYPCCLPLLAECSITKPRNRRKLLQRLMGRLFHQVSAEMAVDFARTQFLEKKVETKAKLDLHLKEARSFWRGLEREWHAGLTIHEQGIFGRLASKNHRDAFRIIRSFARFARQKGEPDFHVVRDNLAARLGITGPGAGGIIHSFCEPDVGILVRTQEYQPHKRAARYRFTGQVLGNQLEPNQPMHQQG